MKEIYARKRISEIEKMGYIRKYNEHGSTDSMGKCISIGPFVSSSL